MTFGQRLVTAREEKDMSQRQLAGILGITPTRLNYWEKDKRQPDVAMIKALSETLDVSSDYLIGNKNRKSPALSSEALRLARDYDGLDRHGRHAVRVVTDAEIDRISDVPEQVTSIDELRHYLTPAAAGYAQPIEGEDYELIPRTSDVPAGADFCLEVSGDSMEPYIKDGQRIYVQRADAEEFQPALFFVDGDVYVKQWCVDHIGTLYLLSANPDRQDANITILKNSDRSVVCFGRVLLPQRLPRPVYR